MRLLIVISAIFASFVLLGLWVSHTLTTTADVMSENIVEIMQEIDQGEWDSAFKKTKDLEDYLDENSGWWPMIIDHQEIDNVKFAMARLKEYISTESIDLSKGQLSELKLMIKHIPEREAVTLRNIL